MPSIHKSQVTCTTEQWLSVHKLQMNELKELLDYISNKSHTSLHFAKENLACDPRQTDTTMTGEQSYQLACSALVSDLPIHAEKLRTLLPALTRCFRRKWSGRASAYTVADDGKGSPGIYIDYRGHVVDILRTAHEVGHASQYALSKPARVPPMDRELCAFIAEQIALKHCLHIDEDLGRDIEKAWHCDNSYYLVNLVDRLCADLKNDRPVYRYYWNYPIARFAALNHYPVMSTSDLQSLFDGKLSGAYYLKKNI